MYAAMTYAGSFHAEVEELGGVEEISDDMKVQHKWIYDVRIKGAFKYLVLGADDRDAMKEAFTRKCLECVSAICGSMRTRCKSKTEASLAREAHGRPAAAKDH